MDASEWTIDGLKNATNATVTVRPLEDPPFAIVFIFVACILGAIVRQALKDSSIPYTVVLLVLGLCFGAISRQYKEVQNYTTLAVQSPRRLLAIFLPVLIFQSAFAMDVHTFYRTFSQVCILAVPGLGLAAALTAVMSKFVFIYDWTWMESLLFGAIISATDPVAVVSLLSTLGASKHLVTIIDGESLANDGTAIVLYQIFYSLSFSSLTATDIGLYFPKVALGGSALGLVAGKVVVFWLQHVFNDALVEIAITLASTYLLFYLCEIILGVSGVLAVAMFGIEINQHRSSISPEVEVFLQRFWGVLDYLANTLIFLIVGVAIMEKAFDQLESMDAVYIIIDFLGLTVIRAVVVLVFSPMLVRLGYGLTWQSAVILIWSGLRGAVGLALSLQVAMSEPHVGNKMMLHTSGIVLLTLLINATTLKSLLGMLGMSQISGTKRAAMNNALKRLSESQQRTFSILKTDRFLADADWVLARAACDINNPYDKNHMEDNEVDSTYLLRYSRCPECLAMVQHEPSTRESAEMAEEARVAMLKAEKMSFWRQFERGVLSSEAVDVLSSISDICLDKKGRFIQPSDLAIYFKVPRYWEKIRTRLEKFRQARASDRVPPPRNLFLRYCFLITTHTAFDIAMNILIAINMILIALELAIPADVWYMDYLRTGNYIYCGIYIFEAILKMLAFRVYYFKDKWNLMDLAIVVMSVVDIAIEFYTDGMLGHFSPSMFKLARTFRVLRMGRMLKLIKTLIPKLIDIVNNRINVQLSFGYDIGKGFVVAEEEVSKIMDQLCPDKNIVQELKRKSNKGRLDIVKSLGLLQRQHPGVAISVKTRQAIRTILNNARDSLNDLRCNGVLDKHEAEKLERAIDVKIKRQFHAPPYISPKRPEDVLRSLIWLRGLEDEAINYITNSAEMLSFDIGDAIVKQGDLCDGIYLIISGMVKLVGVSVGLTSVPFGNVGPQEIREVEESNLGIMVDYLYSGNVIGEMGVLTDSVRNASVTCETIVQAFFIGADKLRRAMGRFKGLSDSLWRVCAIRTSLPLLMESSNYKVCTKEYLRLLCENSRMANLEDTDTPKVFHIPDNVREAVLVHGEVVNVQTNEALRSPILLPSSQKFYLFDERKPAKILLIFKHGGDLPTKADDRSNLGKKYAISHTPSGDIDSTLRRRTTRMDPTPSIRTISLEPRSAVTSKIEVTSASRHEDLV